MNRYAKYSLQSALDLSDGFCRYLIQDRCWGPQEILDVEAVVYRHDYDAEQMLCRCQAQGDPAFMSRLRYFLAENLHVHLVHRMDDRRVIRETARQLTHHGCQVVLEPGLGWAVQVDAATAAPVLPVAVEPEPEVSGAVAELKVVLDELVAEQRKKYDQCEAQLSGLSETEKAALYGKKAGGALWGATVGGAVDIVKALPGFAAGYFKALRKIAMLPGEIATATARSLATGDMTPLKAEADKYIQPLAKSYDEAMHLKSMLVVLYEDEQTMGLLKDFSQDYWDATHPLERTEMGVSAASDIIVTILLAFVTVGVGAAANVAAKSTRLAKAAKLLDKIAGMLKRTGHRHRIPKKDVEAKKVPIANKRPRKDLKDGIPEPGDPNRFVPVEKGPKPKDSICTEVDGSISPITNDYGVAFFGDDNLKYYTGSNVKLGAPGGKPFFFMPLEDSAAVKNAGDAARLTGMAPSAQRAYLKNGEIFGVSFPTDGLNVKAPTAADAGGWPHFLEGGHTAVKLEGPDAGYLVNTTKEFVTPGGNPMPKGSVLFKLGQNGEWLPIRKF